MARLAALLGASLVVLFGAGQASAAPEIRRVDTSRYPTIRVRVLAPTRGIQPSLLVDGQRPIGLAATNLGSQRSIVLAIDRSRSMAGSPLTAAVAALRRFLEEKRQSDPVEIVAFGSSAQALTGFERATIDGDIALRTLGVDARRGTALYDAAVLSARDLSLQPRVGRTLIMLTDGADLGSEADLGKAVRLARRYDITIYAIALGSADPSALRALSSGTGGQTYVSPSGATLEGVYRTIRYELGRTWQFEFPTSARPGSDLELVIGAGSERGSRTLRLPGRSSTRAHALVPAGLLNDGGVLLIAVIGGVLLAAGVLTALRRPRADEVRRRLKPHIADPDEPETTVAGNVLARLESSFASSETRLKDYRLWVRLDRLRDRSGLDLRTVHLVYIGVAGAILVGLVAAVSAAPAGVILLLMLLALATPVVVVWAVGARRARLLDTQLPDLLASVASSLRAGHGLKHALASIAEDAPAPASEEFSRVISEARLGWPLDQALLSMCERMGSEDIEFVAAAVRVQSQVGGALAGLFEMVSETIRQRQRHARRVRVLTATGRASATILTMLPFGLAALLTLINHSYLDPLLHTRVGHVLVIASLTWMSIGAIFLRKIVAVKA